MDRSQIVVTAGDTLTMSFDGDLALALAVSFQQCSGDAHMEMNLLFNASTSLVDDTEADTSRCARVREGWGEGGDRWMGSDCLVWLVGTYPRSWLILRVK